MVHLPRSLVLGTFALVVAATHTTPARACMRRVMPPQQHPYRATETDGVIKVAVAREGQRTTLVLANEVEGALRSFALIVPIPARIREKDVRVLDQDPFAPLDAATRPRVTLVVDPNPCGEPRRQQKADMAAREAAAPASAGMTRSARARDYGVEVQGHFEVGDYDMALLAAKNAKGLGEWLRRFKYDVPPEVEALMADYLEKGTRFLVVRVHLKKLLQGKIQRLRPLQIRYQSDELVLPVRMAAVGRDTPSDFVVFALAPQGNMAVESHTTARMTTDQEVPAFVVDELTTIHDDALRHKAAAHREAIALLEFSGPLSLPGSLGSVIHGGSGWVTRYRMRVKRDTHDDLRLRPTSERTPFHVLYRAHQPWQPARGTDLDGLCDEGKSYLRSLPVRLDAQVAALANMTGRDADAIRARMGNIISLEPPPPPGPEVDDDASEDEPALSSTGGLEVSGGEIVVALFLLVLALIGIGRWQRSR